MRSATAGGRPAASASAPAAAAANDGEAAAHLREQVVQRVLSSDVLNSVKAHLRARIYAELKGPGSAACAASPSRQHGGGPSAPAWQPLPAPRRSPSLHQHILNCLLAEYLLAHRYSYTLSVFLSESGSGGLPRLSRAELLRLAGVLPESKVHALLAGPGSQASRPGDVGAGQDGENRQPGMADEDSCAAAASLAERMVAALGTLGGHVSTHSAACQTPEEGWAGGSSFDSSGAAAGAGAASQQLTARLAAIEEEYQRKSGGLEASLSAGLEERMAAYQRECDARCAAQLAERVAAMREGELAAVREEESRRHAAALAAERAALAAAHQEQLALLHKQEEELLDRSRRLAREQDHQREDHLRRMRAEEERLQARRAEVEAKLSAREAAARQQAEQAEAAARAVQAVREEGERRLAARLEETAAREAEAMRAKAAAEAAAGQVSGLQGQLASSLEEKGALRQQLAAQRAEHEKQLSGLWQEAEGLRQERDRLAQAAAVHAAQPAPSLPAGSLSPSDAARLQQAVRRLMGRVEQLQGEVEAGREQLWRGSCGEVERLLGKSIKAHDRALEHAEELRLALSAAAREVADLQQQAALAAAGLEGPLAQALQAVCRDAERWREGAEARLGAARAAEEGLRREAAQLQQRAQANRAAAAAGLQQVLGAVLGSRQRAAAAAAAEFGLAGGSSSEEQSPADAGGVDQARPIARLPGQAAPSAAAVPAMPSGGPSTAEEQGWQGRAQEQRRAPAPYQPAPWPLPRQAAAPASVAGSGPAQDASPSAEGDAGAAGGAPKPPSRTASDILAAYRARQQQRSASGTGGAAGAQPALSPRRTSLGVSREASLPEEGNTGASGMGAGAAGGEGTAGGELAEGAGPGGEGAAGQGPADGDSYYVSDLTTSEDSSRF